MGKKGRLSDKYKLVVIEYSQDGKYSIWNIDNNNVVTMLSDGYKIYGDDELMNYIMSDHWVAHLKLI